MRGWRRRDVPPTSGLFHGFQVWISRSVGYVGEHEVMRVYRNAIGDWCAEIVVVGKMRAVIFDYHPTLVMLRGLKANGTDIADEVVSLGAEGEDIRAQARRTND